MKAYKYIGKKIFAIIKNLKIIPVFLTVSMYRKERERNKKLYSKYKKIDKKAEKARESKHDVEKRIDSLSKTLENALSREEKLKKRIIELEKKLEEEIKKNELLSNENSL